MKNMILFYREKSNISQKEMARNLKVSPSYLCRVEQGRQRPSDRLKKACANFLKISLDSLFPSRINRKKIDAMNLADNNLWLVRKKKNLKQKELAKLLNCSPSFLCKIEKGQKEPSADFKKKCAQVLKVKEAKLF